MFDSGGYKLKAGAVVTKKENDKNYLLLVKRKLWNDYTFPKGSIEIGETPEEAAIREVEEEAGITIKIIQELPEQKYCFPNSGKVKVRMYLGKEIREIETDKDEIPVWIEESEVQETLSHQDLKDYYAAIKDKIYE